MKAAVIGGGAAGCFAAILLKRLSPGTDVHLYEASGKLLSKVAVTGGGRCNITNTFESILSISQAYPRGGRLMERLLKRFSQEDTLQWFRSEGVRFTAQEDGCVFPASQDAMQIVRTLEKGLERAGVEVHTRFRVKKIERAGTGFSFTSSNNLEASSDLLLLTAGGQPKATGFDMLSPMGITIVPPVPSLYTFRISDPSLKALAGTVVKNASASIPGTSFKASGPLLITDWGVSGPAILKLSSHAARHLSDNGFHSPVRINWLGESSQEEAHGILDSLIRENQGRLLQNARPESIPSRLWKHLIARSRLRDDIRCGETGSKGLNRLAETMVSDIYEIDGRAAFKEEFVTCGGVSLKEINPATMEHKKIPGLFFAGEILDIDAITGGFNLQAAWTTGATAAYAMATLISDMRH